MKENNHDDTIKKEAMTPMMRQYFDMKAEYPEALLLFRCGDFYETYGDDAVTASKVLGIVLTPPLQCHVKPHPHGWRSLSCP